MNGVKIWMQNYFQTLILGAHGEQAKYEPISSSTETNRHRSVCPGDGSIHSQTGSGQGKGVARKVQK